MTARPVPVCIRGVHYPSIVAAARALGVTPSAIQHALDDGNVDRVGTGKTRARPYTYEGVTYRSQAACARAYGVPSNTFNDRLNRGLDPVAAKPRQPPRVAPRNPPKPAAFAPNP